MSDHRPWREVRDPEFRPPLITVQQETRPPAAVVRSECPNCGKRL